MESSEENMSEIEECSHLHTIQENDGLVCTDCGQSFASQNLVDDAPIGSPKQLKRTSNDDNGSFMATKRLLKSNNYYDRMEVCPLPNSDRRYILIDSTIKIV